jgi:MinD-like ATPase involved in chromosome partitioning or flagellar assembly
VVSWERFAAEPSSTDALAERGWVPPAPPEPPAEWGRHRTVLKVLSLGLAKPKPGREELAYRHDVRVIRQATWPRAVRIAVTNPKGGSGKTPTAVILGGVLASVRGGSVAVWDAADAAGTLGGRTEGVAARCVADIDADPDAYAAPSTVGMVAATQTSFADVLGSLREREFTADSIHRVSAVLDRTYRISVADTGNVPHSPAFTRTIALADILVVPTTLTADSVNKAVALLRRLQDTPTGLAQRAVVAVLHTRGPQTPGLAGQIEPIFAAAGVGAVVDIPFDPHLAAGTAISLGSLSHQSRLAWTRLAAATVANLTAT